MKIILSTLAILFFLSSEVQSADYSFKLGQYELRYATQVMNWAMFLEARGDFLDTYKSRTKFEMVWQDVVAYEPEDEGELREYKFLQELMSEEKFEGIDIFSWFVIERAQRGKAYKLNYLISLGFLGAKIHLRRGEKLNFSLGYHPSYEFMNHGLGKDAHTYQYLKQSLLINADYNIDPKVKIDYALIWNIMKNTQTGNAKNVDHDREQRIKLIWSVRDDLDFFYQNRWIRDRKRGLYLNRPVNDMIQSFNFLYRF